MGARGPVKRPRLAVVREGNPGHETTAELSGSGVLLPPATPREPDWRTWFPGNGADAVKAREVARSTWRRVVPLLDGQGLLSDVDTSALSDLCVCEARVVMCEREITRSGIWVQGERGAQKNPAMTAANMYRTQLRTLYVQLLLTPAARARATSAGGGNDNDGAGGAFD